MTLPVHYRNKKALKESVGQRLDYTETSVEDRSAMESFVAAVAEAEKESIKRTTSSQRWNDASL